MKKLTLLLAILPLLLFAQAPNEEDILGNILDSSSPLYYPSLMTRYDVGDMTLSEKEYHYLYYGFAYQDNYKPLAVNPELDKTLLLVSGMDAYKPLMESVQLLITYVDRALTYDPFSPQLLNLMAFAYGALEDKDREAAYYRKMEYVLKAIENSGSSLKQKDPQYIIMFSHAIDLLASKSINHDPSRVISRTVEFIPRIAPTYVDGKKVKGYYFDFGRVYWNKPEGYTYKRDRTWQFNNLKPKTYK